MSETLEQVAEKLYPVFYRSTPFGSKYPWIPQKEREAFKRGAKWQQERSYSEEEVLKLTLDSLDLGMRIRQDQLRGYSEKSGKELHSEWFEEFKKK